MKKTTRQIITELKQKQHLQQMYKNNSRDLDNYFPVSGKINKGQRFYKVQDSNL